MNTKSGREWVGGILSTLKKGEGFDHDGVPKSCLLVNGRAG